MAWNEHWRHEERPDASEIPNEYSVVPVGRGKLMIAYFIGLYVLYYAALKLFGTQALLVAGYPVLMWLAGLLILFTIVGMYALVWRPAIRSEEDTTRETDHESPETTAASAESD